MEKSDYWHFIYILRGKVNRISTNSRHFTFPYDSYATVHYKGLTQGNYRKATGKVNQFAANLWHFSL